MIPNREKRPWHRLNVWYFSRQNGFSKTALALKEAQIFFSSIMRKDGRKEFSHAYRVAQILIFHGVLEDEIIAAGIFHDLFENISFELWGYLEEDYGEEVALIVWLLSRREGESERYYFARIGEDVITILVKIADRLHNLRNMTKNLGRSDFFTLERLIVQIEETWEYLIPMSVRAAAIGCQYKNSIEEMHEELLRSLADAQWAVDNFE
ncbi:MAG: HD domain-containing protein [Candidatus Moraniibacteriota bacterium]